MPQPPLTVLMTIRALPASCRPGLVTPLPDGGAVVALDPSASVFDAVQVCVEGLTEPQLNRLRDMFGEPPVPQPLSDFWMRQDVAVDLELIPDEALTSRALRIKHALRRQVGA